jgi:hypothetical protein
VVVDAEVNKEQGRPLFGVNGEVCKKVVQKKKKGLDRADIVRDALCLPEISIRQGLLRPEEFPARMV